MKEQVKVLINSKKEAKQVKAILKGLGEELAHNFYDDGDTDQSECFYSERDGAWLCFRCADSDKRKEISIRDLIILLTKPEEEKVFIMTSEDGVKLYVGSGHDIVTLCASGKWTYAGAQHLIASHMVVTDPDRAKAFSTKEAAEKWILEQNKPHQIEIKHNDSETSTVMKDKVFIECFDKGKLVQVVHLSKAAIEQITEAFKKINNQQHEH